MSKAFEFSQKNNNNNRYTESTDQSMYQIGPDLYRKTIYDNVKSRRYQDTVYLNIFR